MGCKLHAQSIGLHAKHVSNTGKNWANNAGKYFCTMEKQIGKHITTSLQDCDTFWKCWERTVKNSNGKNNRLSEQSQYTKTESSIWGQIIFLGCYSSVNNRLSVWRWSMESFALYDWFQYFVEQISKKLGCAEIWQSQWGNRKASHWCLLFSALSKSFTKKKWER